MALTAVLILLCWLLAWIEIASGGESFWTKLVREAKRRARQWTE